MEPRKTTITCPGCSEQFSALRSKRSRTGHFRCTCPFCRRSMVIEDEVHRRAGERRRGTGSGSTGKVLFRTAGTPKDEAAPGRDAGRGRDVDGEPESERRGRGGKERSRGSAAQDAFLRDYEPPLFDDPPPREREPDKPKPEEEVEKEEDLGADADERDADDEDGDEFWAAPDAGFTPLPPLEEPEVERGRAPPRERLSDRKAAPVSAPDRRRRTGDGFRLTATTMAAVLLTVTFMLGVLNAFFFLPQDNEVDNLEDLFTSGTGTLSGKVLDKGTGHALAGVDIQLEGRSQTATTNDEGWYYLENVEEGDYTLVAELRGYGTITRKITFRSSVPHSEILEMEAGGEPVEQDRRSPLRDRPPRDPKLTGYIMGVLSVPPLLAAVLALRRERFRVAVACAFLGCFSLGFLIGSGLSFVGMALIIYSRDKFSDARRPPPASRVPPDDKGGNER